MTIEQLPGDVTPSELLEQRTVERLHREGLLARSSARGRPRWFSVAAGLLLFIAGAASGAMFANEQENAPGQPRFLLLLHGGGTTSAGDEQRAVSAYRAWAMRLTEQGRYVSGERLGHDSVVVPQGAQDDPVQGYFIVSAASLAEAVAIAETAPHVARGGRVVVRPIDTP